MAAAPMPSAVAITSGLVPMRLSTSIPTDATLFLSGLAIAIMNGTSENNKSVSKQKISATGTAACAPKVASARPGPM